MILPANLQHQQANVNTSGTINTQITTSVVTAPGVGLRLRIWLISIGFALATFTGTKLVCAFSTSGGLSKYPLNASLGQPSASLWIPGGIALGANLNYGCTHACDVATQSIWITVDYTVEGP